MISQPPKRRDVGRSRPLSAGLARRLPRPLVRAVGRYQHLPLFGLLGRAARASLSVDGVIAHGEAAGLRFNAQGGNAGFALGTSEPDVQLAFSALLADGQVVYDVGAASGFYTVMAARRVGVQGRVIAFEPRPDNAGRVRYNADLNAFSHVETLELAVSDREGAERFSLGADANRGGLTAQHSDPLGSPAIEVRTASIDQLVGERTIPAPHVVKMDIEGAEVEALRGARRTLTEHRPILLIELHGRGPEVEELLLAHGYVSKVVEDDVPVSQTEWGMHVVARPA
jgi:FkbM family methyltransferase